MAAGEARKMAVMHEAVKTGKIQYLLLTEVTEGSRMSTKGARWANLVETTRNRVVGPSLRYLVLNWATKDKYTELKQ